jgi:hypothetical protein
MSYRKTKLASRYTNVIRMCIGLLRPILQITAVNCSLDADYGLGTVYIYINVKNQVFPQSCKSQCNNTSKTAKIKIVIRPIAVSRI